MSVVQGGEDFSNVRLPGICNGFALEAAGTRNLLTNMPHSSSSLSSRSQKKGNDGFLFRKPVKM
jgi:hypothetical protein